MKNNQTRLLLLVASFAIMSCDRNNGKQEVAEGLSFLDDNAIEALVGESGWGKADIERASGLEIVGAFSIASDFGFDLGEDATLPISAVPDGFYQGSDSSGSPKSMLVLRRVDIVTPVTTYVRFEAVATAQVSQDLELHLGSEDLAAYVEATSRPSRANGQEGNYLLIAGKKAPLTLLTGHVEKITENISQPAYVTGAVIYDDQTPFIARTVKQRADAKGQFIWPAAQGWQGVLMAYKAAESKTEAAYTALTVVPYVGTLPATIKASAALKTSDFNASLPDFGDTTTKLDDWSESAASQLSTLSSSFSAGGEDWPLQQISLRMYLPPAGKVDLAAPSNGQRPGTPSKNIPADPMPGMDSPIMRTPLGEETTAPQIDLGCTGIMQDGVTLTQMVDGTQFSDASRKGWRFQGDARVTTEMHAAIFGAPEVLGSKESRYLDKMTGYCLISTGDSLFQRSVDQDGNQFPLLNTTPEGVNGPSRSSEMWQRVKVPIQAKSIQMRVAFFSQEYPQFIGTPVSDRVVVKFDEALTILASGDLSDLAATRNGVDLSRCHEVAEIAPGDKATCGDWEAVANHSSLTGALWDIDESKQAIGGGEKFACLGGLPNGKCFHGWIKPSVICRSLSSGEQGKTLTLRLSISDVGDTVYDSAMAIDSIVFSTQGCTAAELFTGEKPSQLSEVPGVQ